MQLFYKYSNEQIKFILLFAFKYDILVLLDNLLFINQL